jgi:hypothetical protein
VGNNTTFLSHHSNLHFLFDMIFFPVLFGLFHSLSAPRLELLAENLALRQQLAVLNRTAKRLKLGFQDHLFWSILPRLWKNWPSALPIIKPEAVISMRQLIRPLPGSHIKWSKHLQRLRSSFTAPGSRFNLWRGFRRRRRPGMGIQVLDDKVNL